MSGFDGTVSYTSREKAAEAAKRATLQTGIPHRAVRACYYDYDLDADPVVWTKVPCYVLLVLEPRRAS